MSKEINTLLWHFKRGKMDSLKKHYKLILSVFAFFFALYVLPNFINLNNQKSYIENKIQSTFGFRASIKGDISFAILPRPSVILRNVEISSMDEKSTGAFINASKVFINTGFLNFFSDNFVINKIAVMDATFYENVYKNSQYENLDTLLNGKIFKEVTIKNGRVVLADSFITNINVRFKTVEGSKVKGNGSFYFEDGEVDNLSFLFSYIDSDNFNAVTNFNYITGKSKLDNDFTIIVKEGEKTISGNVGITTDSLLKFTKKFIKSVELPNTQFFNDSVKLKFNIQNSPNSILLNNGSIEGSEVVGKFKGVIPFAMQPDGKNGIDRSGVNFSIDFSTFPVAKFIDIKANDTYNPVNVLLKSQKLLSLFQYANFNITAKNIVATKSMITDFRLNTTPIFYGDTFNGINISDLGYSINKKPIKISGKILNVLNDDLTIDVRVASNISRDIKNIFTPYLQFNRLNADITMSKSFINILNMTAEVGGNLISGYFTSKTENGKTDYVLNIKSDFVNLDKLIKENIDLSFIISKLSLIRSSSFNLNVMIKKLRMNNSNYDNFKLNTSYLDGSLNLKNLTFNHQGYQSAMKGELFNILSSAGEFKNFSYNISSSTLKGISIPFIKNQFIETMIANGVNRIDILLNGSASNPISQVDAKLNDIKIKVNGKLLDTDASYTIELSHNELKGFLFSWGFISDNLVNYFYDNIPFSLKARVEGYNIKDMEFRIKNNVFTGEILRKKDRSGFETSVALNTQNFNIKDVIKRIKDTDGYVDFLLKIIRDIPYNIYLNAKNISEYNGNNYKDVIFDLKNSTNPGNFKFKLKKQDYEIDLNSEILNSNMFDGTVKISNYQIPNDIMNNELLNLVSGTLNADIKFKTNGMNAYQLLSNLSGNYSVDILNGKISGISDYSTILANILKLANITTNNVIYTLENSLKSGSMEFPKLSVEGEISSADVKDSAFNLSLPNMNISGMLSGNLIQKSLNIESIFDISNLAPDNLVFSYDLKGFVNNLTGKVDTTSITSKINPVYLLRKKKEILQ